MAFHFRPDFCQKLPTEHTFMLSFHPTLVCWLGSNTHTHTGVKAVDYSVLYANQEVVLVCKFTLHKFSCV